MRSKRSFARSVSVIGVGMAQYGDRLETPEILNMSMQDMAAWAVADALEDAGVNPRDVGKLVVGYVSSLFYGGQSITPASGLSEFLGMKGNASVAHEEACGTSANCFNEAVESVASGRYDIVVCVSCDSVRCTQAPDMPSCYIFPSNQYEKLYGRAWAGGSCALDTAYARWTGAHYGHADSPSRHYIKENNITDEELDDALIGRAITARQCSALNPKTFLKTSWEDTAKARGYDDVWEFMKSQYNPKYTEYVRVSSSGAMTDGATAIVICATELASDYRQTPIEVVGIAQSDMSTLRPGVQCTIANNVGKEIYEITGYKPSDIEYLQTTDMDMTDSLYSAEAVGYLPKGEGWRYFRDGLTKFDSEKPMNTDGGHPNYGHAFTATQIATLVEPILQMRGQAGERQIPKPPKVSMARIQGGFQTCAAYIFKTVDGIKNKQQPAASRFEPKPYVKMFYDALAEGKFLGMKCPVCGHVEFPLYPICNECGNIGNEIIEVSRDVTVNEIYKILPAFLQPEIAPYAPVFLAEITHDQGSELQCMIFGITPETYSEYKEKVPFKAQLVPMPDALGYDFNTFAVAINGVLPVPKMSETAENKEWERLKAGKMNEVIDDDLGR